MKNKSKLLIAGLYILASYAGGVALGNKLKDKEVDNAEVPKEEILEMEEA